MSIDAEAVEKNVNDSYKMMHKLVRLFQESPGQLFTLFKMRLISFAVIMLDICRSFTVRYVS